MLSAYRLGQPYGSAISAGQRYSQPRSLDWRSGKAGDVVPCSTTTSSPLMVLTSPLRVGEPVTLSAWDDLALMYAIQRQDERAPLRSFPSPHANQLIFSERLGEPLGTTKTRIRLP